MIRALLRHKWLVLTATIMATAPLSLANQMRSFEAIPSAERDRSDLPDGSALITNPDPIPRGEVSEAAEELADAWNGPGLSGLISEAKFDKSRFERAMITEVPRDASLTLESVRGVQTLNQSIQPDGRGGFNVVSTVSATISTRLTANDPTAGFVNAPGVNEIVFQVTEPLE